MDNEVFLLYCHPDTVVLSVFVKKLPLQVRAHICGINRHHIVFYVAKIRLFVGLTPKSYDFLGIDSQKVIFSPRAPFAFPFHISQVKVIVKVEIIIKVFIFLRSYTSMHLPGSKPFARCSAYDTYPSWLERIRVSPICASIFLCEWP